MPDYCALDLPGHEELECNEKLYGGNSSIGFLSTNHQITDFEDPTQLQAEIDAGRLSIAKKIKAEIPDASPIEGESLTGCGPEITLDGFDRSITWMDGKVSKTNVDYYKSLNRWQGFLLIYNCSEKQLFVEDQTTVSVRSFLTVPASKKQPQVWKGTAKWSSFDGLELYDASALASIFE